MSSLSSWKPYYEITKDRPPDQILEFACARVDPSLPKVAIDCGCGAGRSTEFLLAQGFSVAAFDMDPEAVRVCLERFADRDDVQVAQDSFASFDYPEASLLLASYSLFFCPCDEYATAWSKMVGAIVPQGVFCGTFLGPNDTWAQPGYVFESAPERKVVSHSESEVLALFDGLEILERDVKEFDGTTSLGDEKHWHTIAIVARKARSS